jgi:hypothetical protein
MIADGVCLNMRWGAIRKTFQRKEFLWTAASFTELTWKSTDKNCQSSIIKLQSRHTIFTMIQAEIIYDYRSKTAQLLSRIGLLTLFALGKMLCILGGLEDEKCRNRQICCSLY